ncbi:MAG: transglutaminase-like domain-containing protein [Candidatus Nanoarchaeia archaeon]|nr:transglutaminase-like domain-containing protein [Candidatus Nanoarchaeia archaeon]
MNQVIIDEEIFKISKSIDGEDLVYFRNVINWIHSFFTYSTEDNFKSKNFRKRNSKEILKSRVLTGCTDYSLIFLALIRAKNYKGKFMELFKRYNQNRIEGHVIVKVYFNSEIYFVDPTNNIIDKKFDYFESKGYKLIAEGEDSWDLGIHSIDDLKKLIDDFLKII